MAPDAAVVDGVSPLLSEPHAAKMAVAAALAKKPRRESGNLEVDNGDGAEVSGAGSRGESLMAPSTITLMGPGTAAPPGVGFVAMSKPLGPYTPVIRAGDFVIVSGQGGMLDGVKVDGGVHAETVQTMKNVATQLATVGASLDDVVKTTCFLTDMENFHAFNDAYAEALGAHRPARSTVAVAGLPANFLVEVEAWAYVPQG